MWSSEAAFALVALALAPAVVVACAKERLPPAPPPIAIDLTPAPPPTTSATASASAEPKPRPPLESAYERWRIAIEVFVPRATPGASIALDEERRELFAKYIAKLHDKVHPIFSKHAGAARFARDRRAFSNAGLSVEVELAIDGATGRVRKFGVARRSEVVDFDAMALDAIKEAQPFSSPRPSASALPTATSTCDMDLPARRQRSWLLAPQRQGLRPQESALAAVARKSTRVDVAASANALLRSAKNQRRSRPAAGARVTSSRHPEVSMTVSEITHAEGTAAEVLTALSNAADAELDGDYETTLRLLDEAHKLGHDDSTVHAHVHWTTAKFYARHDRWFTAASHAARTVLVSLF